MAEIISPLKCPNCRAVATLINSAKGIYQCSNSEDGCYGLRFEDKGNHQIHIVPEDLHIFFRASGMVRHEDKKQMASRSQ